MRTGQNVIPSPGSIIRRLAPRRRRSLLWPWATLTILSLVLSIYPSCSASVPQPTIVPTAVVMTSGIPPVPPTATPRSWTAQFQREVFQRTDLIYGTEIGSWRYNGSYDGYPLLKNQACQALARDAKISVVRWMPEDRFTDNGGDLTTAEFDNVIDGIRAVGALPLIKTPPGIHRHFNEPVDLQWLKEIVRRAGSRVTLYEFTNEPNYYGDWSAARYVEEWVKALPELKRYARSLGFEIYVGGPTWAWPDIGDMEAFIEGVKTEHDLTGDDDLIPSFLSFHIYASKNRAESSQVILSRIPEYGQYISSLRDASRQTLGFELPIAVTEWNFTVDSKDTRDQDGEFITAFTSGMLKEFRARGVWLANQFTFASGAGGGNLDMVGWDCKGKPMYYAFRDTNASEAR